ncbi:unnamed protein product [Periconia digitata]|uniref:Rhodopsin domain-containing protein n=1 Tax=Periconia digitata TaxID=1303443 RepID=A0A9W4URX7_9PLEO|nr:unnamed protein product [Periconia digitata]
MPEGGELINGLPAEYWNESRVDVLIGASTFLIILTVVTIVLRFYARISSRAPLWWDDWFALATVPFALLNPVYDLVQIHYGFGRHQAVMVKTDPHRAEIFFFNLYIILIFYNVGLAIFKYSFLALYIRLFRVSTKLRYSCYVLGVLITMWSVSCVFAIVFRCRPVQANWDPTAGKCIPMRPVFLGQAIPTIIFDIIILLLPVRLVWAIQMPRPAKIGVLVVFVLGGLVAVISIVRLYVVLNTTEADVPWDYPTIGLWSAGEPITGLVCCSLPAYTPVLRRVLAHFKIGWSSMSQRTSRNKSKGPVSLIPSSVRTGRYQRSGKGSDTFELTETGHGDESLETRVDYGGHGTNHGNGGIRVLQEVDVQSHTKSTS